MVRNFLDAIGREVRGMHEAAYLLAAFALGSQLLALVRDRLLAGTFGAGHTLDIYYAAFRIPDFLFATVASLLSLYALLPILSKLEHKSRGLAISFMRNILLIFFVGMSSIALILYFLTPTLVPLIAPGIAADIAARTQLVALIHILLLQPILLGASNIFAALTQLRNRFFLYAISPLLYNLGIIFGIIFLYPRLGIEGLAWGVVLGAILHMLIQVPFFAIEKSQSLPFREVWPAFISVLKLSLPRTLALAAGQVSLLLLVAIASLFATGSVAIFMFAWNLQSVPLAIIGVSYSVAAFPTLARFHASGNTREFVKHIEEALRHIFFWSIPAIVLIIVLRAQLVRSILGTGAFDWDATRLTAAALALFVISLSAQSVSMLIARTYYAAGKTKMPLVFAMVSVIVSIVCALAFISAFRASPFIKYFTESLFRVTDIVGTSVLMLALAFTVGSLVQCVLGLWCMKKDFELTYKNLRKLVFQSFAASVIGGAAAYGGLVVAGELVDINTTVGIVTQGFVGGVLGLLTVGLVLTLLKNQELAVAISALKRKFKDSGPVALEPTDVSS